MILRRIFILINYERTDRQEWIDFQNKFLSRPSRHRNLIVRYAVVATVCIAVLTVLLIYRSRQENVTCADFFCNESSHHFCK